MASLAQAGETSTSRSATTAPPQQQVPLTLKTSIPELSLPPTSYLVPTSFSRTQLSTLVNRLLAQTSGLTSTIPFDFIVDGQLLRESLDSWLDKNGKTVEEGIELEYIKSTLPPKWAGAFEHDDWIASIDASRDGLVRNLRRRQERKDGSLTSLNLALPSQRLLDGFIRLVHSPLLVLFSSSSTAHTQGRSFWIIASVPSRCSMGGLILCSSRNSRSGWKCPTLCHARGRRYASINRSDVYISTQAAVVWNTFSSVEEVWPRLLQHGPFSLD